MFTVAGMTAIGIGSAKFVGTLVATGACLAVGFRVGKALTNVVDRRLALRQSNIDRLVAEEMEDEQRVRGGGTASRLVSDEQPGFPTP